LENRVCFFGFTDARSNTSGSSLLTIRHFWTGRTEFVRLDQIKLTHRPWVNRAKYSNCARREHDAWSYFFDELSVEREEGRAGKGHVLWETSMAEAEF
jgi:hypothetical protein